MRFYFLGLLGLIILTYLVVLTIDAPHIAVTKEHCP
jgi:hypothetical protein